MRSNEVICRLGSEAGSLEVRIEVTKYVFKRMVWIRLVLLRWSYIAGKVGVGVGQKFSLNY